MLPLFWLSSGAGHCVLCRMLIIHHGPRMLLQSLQDVGIRGCCSLCMHVALAYFSLSELGAAESSFAGIMGPIGMINKIKLSVHPACRDEQVQATVEAALKEGSSGAAGLTYDDVARALEGRELDMTVEMPTDD